MLRKLKETFNDIYLLVYGEEYTFANRKVERWLQNFVKKMPTGAGEDWLASFTLFQFSYYDGMKARSGRVYLNWIYGDKAMERWTARTDAQTYYAARFAAKIGYRREPGRLPAGEYLETERKRFAERGRLLLHCEELALFSDSSDTCARCENYVMCKDNDNGRV